MAQISITIDDANIADVRDALCVRWSADQGLTNPEKVAFIKARIARWIKDEYKFAKADISVVASIESVRRTAFDTAETANIS